MKRILLGMIFLVSLMLCFSSPVWAGAQEDFDAGMAAFERADYALAITHLNKALKLPEYEAGAIKDGSRTQAHYLLGLSLLHQVNYSPARWHLQETINRVDHRVHRRYQNAPLYGAVGFVKYKKGEKDGETSAITSAIGSLSDAIRLNPRYAEAFCLRGHCWLALGVYYMAIADYDMALSIDPNLSEAITYRNKALEQQGRAATGQ
jgi:tetratricopeptide (TPR) repeat protein